MPDFLIYWACVLAGFLFGWILRTRLSEAQKQEAYHAANHDGYKQGFEHGKEIGRIGAELEVEARQLKAEWN